MTQGGEGLIMVILVVAVFIGMYIYGEIVSDPKEHNEKKEFIEEKEFIKEKECDICKKTKPLNDFPIKEYESAIILRLKRPDIFDGHYDRCKQCVSEKEQETKIMLRAKEEERKKQFAYNQEQSRKWNEIFKQRAKERHKDRMATDPVYAMKYRLRNRTARAFKENGYPKTSKTAEILGCEWETLANHIESGFTDGMTWENRSEWHVDHIVPLASANTEDELIILCHYTNLQPLWAEDNIRKSDKMPE